MADTYLDSTGAGTPASPWGTYGVNEAHSIIALDANAVMGADDVTWVANDHTESTSSIATITSHASATAVKPHRFFAVSDIGTNSSFVTAPSATLTATANAVTSFQLEKYIYLYGFIWQSTSTGGSSGLSAGYTNAGPHNITLNNCQIGLGNSSAAKLHLGNIANTGNDETQTLLNDSVYFPNNAGNKIVFNHGRHLINNLAFHASAVAPTSLFSFGSAVAADVLVENSDLSGKSFTNLFDSSGSVTGLFRGRNLKLPSSCTSYCTDNIAAPGMRFILDDFTVGTTPIAFYRRYFSGEIVYETGIIPNSTTDRMYLRNDESDSGYSIKIVAASSNCSKWEPVYTDWIHIEVENTSTAITPYAEILVSGDGATALKDNECWIEVDVMTGSGRNATRSSDAASLNASGTNQASGTITWTGHGYSAPTTHKVALGSAVTPGQKGYIRLRVALAKANTSVFVGKAGYT